jgi:hypothetical protein
VKSDDLIFWRLIGRFDHPNVRSDDSSVSRSFGRASRIETILDQRSLANWRVHTGRLGENKGVRDQSRSLPSANLPPFVEQQQLQSAGRWE